MSNESNTSALLTNHRKAIAIAVSTAIAGTGSAQAQNTLEEIIVTATKREESAKYPA